MHVKELQIQGFRGFSALHVRPQGHVVVMGEPGAGRSDLIEALARVLDADTSRTRITTELDFWNRNTSEPIQIAVTLGELGDDLEQDFFDHLELWDRSEESLLEETKDIDDVDKDQYEWVLRLEYRARWLVDEERCEEWLFYPKESDPASESYLHVRRRDIEKLGFNLLRWSGGRILDLNPRSAFRQVIRTAEGNDFAASITAYVQDVGVAAGQFTSSAQIMEALDDVVEPLRDLLGIAGTDVAQLFQFAPEGGSPSGLLRSLGPSMDVGDGSGSLPVWRRGSSTASLFRIAEALALLSGTNLILAVDDFGDGLDAASSAHMTAIIRRSSETRSRLLGQERSKLRYKDLIPGALAILEDSSRVRQLVASRWGLVICDEAQDTSTEQWHLLRMLASRKVLLLGDPNQMIYTFIKGVSPERFREMEDWADRQIQLDPRSHRDPSGAIPALAEAVRQRRFDDEAVLEALRTSRLEIHFDVADDERQNLLSAAVTDARNRKYRDVGIFAHSNASVAELAEELSEVGIDHVIIGIPEAHAEALGSMAAQCLFAMGLATDEEVRESFGLFLTATTRGRQAPPLALALIGESDLPGLIEDAVLNLECALTAAADGTLEDVATVAMQSWEKLGIRAAYRPWRRAAAHFRRLVWPLRTSEVSEESVRRLSEIAEGSRVSALIDLDYSERGTVKLMNYHQTKGREADTVVHVFGPDDYFGSEVEPFEKTSRLLNVAISRARHRVIVVLPPTPHPLVEPFTLLRRYARDD